MLCPFKSRVCSKPVLEGLWIGLLDLLNSWSYLTPTVIPFERAHSDAISLTSQNRISFRQCVLPEISLFLRIPPSVRSDMNCFNVWGLAARQHNIKIPNRMEKKAISNLFQITARVNRRTHWPWRYIFRPAGKGPINLPMSRRVYLAWALIIKHTCNSIII